MRSIQGKATTESHLPGRVSGKIVRRLTRSDKAASAVDLATNCACTVPYGTRICNDTAAGIHDLAGGQRPANLKFGLRCNSKDCRAKHAQHAHAASLRCRQLLLKAAAESCSLGAGTPVLLRLLAHDCRADYRGHQLVLALGAAATLLAEYLCKDHHLEPLQLDFKYQACAPCGCTIMLLGVVCACSDRSLQQCRHTSVAQRRHDALSHDSTSDTCWTLQEAGCYTSRCMLCLCATKNDIDGTSLQHVAAHAQNDISSSQTEIGPS